MEISGLNSKTVEGRRLLPGLRVGEGFMRHPFDLEYRVRTSGLVAGRHLKSGHRHDRHATAYYGVAPSVFRALMKRWQRNRPDWATEEVSFIDVGAGMGRALLLASELPFRRVVGVELNPALARIAKTNLAAWRASGWAQAPMRVVCGDAVEFPLPAGPCLAFLFNPFGATVMRRLLKSWSKILSERALATVSHPFDCAQGRLRRKNKDAAKLEHPAIGLDIIYVNHEQEHILERQAGFTRLFLGKVPRSKTDAIADHRIMANQPDGEYASANYEDCSMWRWVR
jgi:SAM-dependent methyltransferase